SFSPSLDSLSAWAVLSNASVVAPASADRANLRKVYGMVRALYPVCAMTEILRRRDSIKTKGRAANYCLGGRVQVISANRPWTRQTRSLHDPFCPPPPCQGSLCGVRLGLDRRRCRAGG